MPVKYCLIVAHPDITNGIIEVVTNYEGELPQWELDEGSEKAPEIMRNILEGRITLTPFRFYEKNETTYLPFIYVSNHGKFTLPNGYRWSDWNTLGFGPLY